MIWEIVVREFNLIPIETIAGWIGTGVVLVGHVAVSQYKAIETQKQVDKLWAWKDAHMDDVVEKRFEMQKQFGALEGRVSVHDGNYARILAMLEEIKSEIKETRDRS